MYLILYLKKDFLGNTINHNLFDHISVNFVKKIYLFFRLKKISGLSKICIFRFKKKYTQIIILIYYWYCILLLAYKIIQLNIFHLEKRALTRRDHAASRSATIVQIPPEGNL